MKAPKTRLPQIRNPPSINHPAPNNLLPPTLPTLAISASSSQPTSPLSDGARRYGFQYASYPNAPVNPTVRVNNIQTSRKTIMTMRSVNSDHGRTSKSQGKGTSETRRTTVVQKRGRLNQRRKRARGVWRLDQMRRMLSVGEGPGKVEGFLLVWNVVFGRGEDRSMMDGFGLALTDGQV